MNSIDIVLRPVTPADRDFLRTVYACTRDAEMAMVAWSAEQKAAFIRMQFEAQSADYGARFPRAQHSVIVSQGTDAGRLYLDRRKEDLHILDVTVLPQFRGKKIGSAVVEQLQAEARNSRRSVTVYVETFNPSLQWFEKRGFVRHKEEGIHVLMQWMP